MSHSGRAQAHAGPPASPAFPQSPELQGPAPPQGRKSLSEFCHHGPLRNPLRLGPEGGGGLLTQLPAPKPRPAPTLDTREANVCPHHRQRQ